ncbi:hypothetical protein PLICRDRAFT_96544, partial [Plicaturopsis crispa FD-325 SS-3]
MSSILSILMLSSLVVADLSPSSPGPSDVFNAGSNCTIKWAPDTTGAWKNVSIKLMSGSNSAMTLVAPVTSALDGTDASLTPFNWTCPAVDPYSSIYFYEFTNDDDQANSKWTSRFTIASPSGETTPPANAAQPNGDAPPWGAGQTAANTT